MKIKVSVQVKSDRNEVHFNCGIPQSAQESAFLPDGYALEYVETIVHPAMLAHPNPLSVLILGGSQKDAEVQAILTEVFRHKSVKIVAVVASLHDKIYNPKADLVDEYNMCSHNTFTTNGKVENLQSLESLYLLLKNQSKHQISFQYSPFDVIILLHPFILFSDDDSYKFVNKHEYKMEQKNITLSTFQMLSQDLFMSRDGILVTHLGPSPNLNQKSKMQHIQNIGGAEHLQAEFIAQMTANTDFVDLHIFEDSNGASFHAPQSYIILCKGKSCRQHWYAEESYMTYQIKKRLLSYPSIIDGAMLLRYNRPPKAWERLFCSFPRNKRQCNYMNGFDPAIPNIYRHEFEVKQSSLGKNAGRGLFTKVDIAEGSYFMQEISVHPVRFSVHSTELIFNTRELIQEIYEGDDDDSNTEDSNSNSEDESGWYEVHVKKQEYKSELDSLLTFLEGKYSNRTDTVALFNHVQYKFLLYFLIFHCTGYGYENDVFVSFNFFMSLSSQLLLFHLTNTCLPMIYFYKGASDSVDSGIGTFMNHGKSLLKKPIATFS